MGCIQSKSVAAQRPIRTNALERANLVSNPLQQRRMQNTQFTVGGTPGEWYMFSQLNALHTKALALIEHIDNYSTNEPELRALRTAATELYNDLGERTLYFEGDSPSRYRARFEEISQNLQARSIPPLHFEQPSLLTSPEVGPNALNSLSSSHRTSPPTPSPR